MSGEFRELGRCHFVWQALEEAGELESGRHPVSAALQKIYSVLAGIEKGCAYYEAYDSGWERPALALIRAKSNLQDAFKALISLGDDYENLLRKALAESVIETSEQA